MFQSRWTARRRGRGSWVSKGIGAQGTSLHALQGDQAQLVPQRNVTASSNINISILKVTQQGQQKRRKSLRSKRPKQHQHKQRWELNEDRNETKSGWKFFKQQGRGEEFQWSQSSICHQARLLLCNVCDFSCVWRHHDCLVRRESGDRTARRESPSASRFENQLKSYISLDYHDHGIA